MFFVPSNLSVKLKYSLKLKHLKKEWYVVMNGLSMVDKCQMEIDIFSMVC